MGGRAYFGSQFKIQSVMSEKSRQLQFEVVRRTTFREESKECVPS